MSKVFICYSHKDKKYLDLLLKHFDNNLLDVWSDKRIKGAEHWEEEIQKALESCNCSILILSANFFNSTFIKDVEVEKLLQNQYEKNTYLLPILVEHCNIDKYKWISRKEVLPKGFKAIENIKKRNLNKEIVKIVKRVEELLEKQPEQKKEKSESTISINYPDNIAENNFPTSNDDFFGREKYFNILDKAWNDEQVNILSIIAFGGVGKTSLIDNWLKRMKKDHYRGAKNIFMWSFYSQGSEEDRQVTAAEFLIEACKFFKIKKIPETAYEQGRELANIISKQRALLILDGLEPLQSSIEDIGELKDNGLQILLKRLSRQNKGLIIITSRIKLASIDNQYEELETLEDSEGAELLKSFDLNGCIKELEQISKDFDGHALSLKLLGSYTKVVLGKDISRINEIESLRDDKTKSSNHATRMLNSYKKYLKSTIELDILKLLGFFDRAISFEVIDVLKNKPLIENINDNLVNVSDRDWNYALNNLRMLSLINNNEKVLDTHPLVREYFSKYIEDNFEDSYVKGHDRLYKYYEKLPKKEFPDTIEEMEPLFHAIYHGTKALNYIDTYNLYIKRIHRVDMTYLVNMLGKYDINLKLLANFYEVPFSLISKNLPQITHSIIEGQVAYCLWIIGRVDNSLKILYKSIDYAFENKQFDILIRNINNIIDINLAQNNFNKIEELYTKYEYLTLKCNDKDKKAIFMASYAYYLYLNGKLIKSEKLFLECEQILIKTASNVYDKANIYSSMGYMFYKLLFHSNKLEEIEKRIEFSLKLSKKNSWKLDIGMDYITLGRLMLLKNEKQEKVINIFNKGIDSLLRSNELNYISEGLIYRAEAFRIFKLFGNCNDDLSEAYDFINRFNFKLSLTIWYIVAINLSLDQKDQNKATTYFNEAKLLSKELDENFIFKEELKRLERNFYVKVINE